MRVVVVGAGIGGLATAIALERAGIESEIVERAPDLRAIQVGYGIHLWSNAMRVLRELELADAVRERSVVFERMHFESLQGKTLFDWPLGEASSEVGEPIVGITRSELHAVLADAAGPDAIRYGASFERYEQDSSGVTVRFADGTETRGDVMIGADGVNSVVRAQLIGDGPPVYLGIAERHATITLPEGLVPANTFHEWWGGRDRFGFYPVKGGTCWYLIGPDARGTTDPDGHKGAVLRKLAGFPQEARAVVDATSAEDVVRLEIFVRKPAKSWARDRVAILGDAAHAMEPSGGQGSAQALEDALVLARCLRDGSDPVAALARYESLRIPRVKLLRRVSTITGRIGRVRNPVARRARNVVLPHVTGTIWKAHKGNLVFEP